MYSNSNSDAIIHGYSVLRVMTDTLDDSSVPIGVIAWDTSEQWYGMRIVDHDENLHLLTNWRRNLINLADKQIRRWADTGEVPYMQEPQLPYSHLFWQSVSEIMTTSIRLDLPKAMESMSEPDEDIESLFEAIVKPIQKSRRQIERIDGAINRALGQKLSKKIHRRITVTAFGDAEEVIGRGLVEPAGTLIIEGVNLASGNARRNADALVSRLLRIKEAYSGSTPLDMIIGYSSSPGGLNGETHMKNWISKMITENVFDLSSERAKFQSIAQSLVEKLATSDISLMYPPHS